jgi:hypothetical protein
MRESVKWFAEQMENTLKKNDNKHGWDMCSFAYLFDSLSKERDELLLSLNKKTQPVEAHRKRIIRECTDVANFAMMIADNIRNKKGIHF